MRDTILISTTFFFLAGVACLAAPHTSPSMTSSLDTLPVYFVENKGQVNEKAAYYLQGKDKTLFFTSNGVTFLIKGKEKHCAVNLEFDGASPLVKPTGEDRQNARFSYFKGDQNNWKTGVAAFKKLVYKDLWPGIDLVYTGVAEKLKYEFVVKPGADPKMIRLVYRGVSGLTVNDKGSLKIKTLANDFEDGIPYAYQVDGGSHKQVSMAYSQIKKISDDSFSFTFDLGAYDSAKTLILDPVLIVYCGYIGGDGGENGFDIAVDNKRRIYVIGQTDSAPLTFPVKTGPCLSYSGGMYDLFVARINSQGTDLEYCGYIGGDKVENGQSIKVDNAGNAYITGYTDSDETSFPVKVGPSLTSGGNFDGFVAKINSQGTDLEYCGYIGGDKADFARDIGIDENGSAYVSGTTQSDENSFPVCVGPDITFSTPQDVFVAKVKSDGTGFDYCGYIGGSGSERADGIAVDKTGCAYVSGTASKSTIPRFPLKVGPFLYNSGQDDIFIAKVNSIGTDLIYCGYIGGALKEYNAEITVDDFGCAYLTGATRSDENSFPVQVGPYITFAGGDWDAYALKVKADGSGLEYCGYIGGAIEEEGYDIVVDKQGCAYITGETASDEFSFPIIEGPSLSHKGGWDDAFIAKVDPTGLYLEYCGYIGGQYGDCGFGIDLDSSGNVYVAGTTQSTEITFPVKKGPDLSYNGPGKFGTGDCFVTKILAGYLEADDSKISAATGGVINFALSGSTLNAQRWYMLLGGFTGSTPGTKLPSGLEVLPLNMDLFTNYMLSFLNTPPFKDFFGTLDNNGLSTAMFDTQSPLPSLLIGTKFYFAFILLKPCDYASNCVIVEIVP